MNKLFVLLLTIFLVASLSASDKDLSQKPKNFDNPYINVGPAFTGIEGALDESFEGGVFPPAGWATLSPDGGTGWTMITVGTTPLPGWTGGVCTATPDGMGGVQMAYATWTTGGASSNDQWLVSSQVTSIVSGDDLKFWMRKFSDIYLDRIEVKISTTDALQASFTTDLAVIDLAATDTGWVAYTYDLDAFAGQDIYIAWREIVADNFNDGAAILLDLVKVEGGVVPVELTSFTAKTVGETIVLNWSTATETNNLGFGIERSVDGVNFTEIGFVDGRGTTAERNEYSFSDKAVNSGFYSYRLKQTDLDGSYEYSSVVAIELLRTPTAYDLAQNYPNPFNPATAINFSLPEAANVKLTVFNTLGQEVADLVNRNFEAGIHTVNFDASSLYSGVYYYRLEANKFVQVRKMMLVK